MIKNTCGQNGFKVGLYKKIAYVYPFLVQNQTHCAIAKRLKTAKKFSGVNEQKQLYRTTKNKTPRVVARAATDTPPQ